MLSPRWRKVLRDLWVNKTRTLLVVLSITVGIFAIGTLATSQVILTRDLDRNYQSINPQSATFYTELFDRSLVDYVRRARGVKEAEGRRSLTVRVQMESGEWRNLELFAVADYGDMRINKVFPDKGTWPPREREVLIERSSQSAVKVLAGDTLLVETSRGEKRRLQVAGVAHDLHVFPTPFGGTAFGYISMETLEWLGEEEKYNQLYITVTGNDQDKEYIRHVAGLVKDRQIEKDGYRVFRTGVPENPGKHPLADYIQTMVVVLGTIGLLSLFLSVFLVVNTILALLAQQVREIGVMKTIGAKPWQVISLYLGVIVAYGIMALVISIPLGALGARAMTDFIAGLFNINLASLKVPPRVLALESVVGLVVPVLAGLYPVIAGTRVTIREALTPRGIGQGKAGRGWVNKGLERIRGISRPLLISLRNTFRRKGRLALTLVTLSMAGAIFMAVFTVRTSLLKTLDDVLQYWNYDVEVAFNQSYPTGQVRREALRVPGVTAAEKWVIRVAFRLRPDGTQNENMWMVALHADTDMVRPDMLRGRWLTPGDANALVVNTDFLKEEPDVDVGKTIVLKIDGKETAWKVTGVVTSQLSGPLVYASYPYFARLTHDPNLTNDILIKTSRHDADSQRLAAQMLEARFKRADLGVAYISTNEETRTRIWNLFNLIVVFLLMMAILLALVGALGLMGTMSLNVLERTREIGVMRAIGATNGAIFKIIMAEGIVVGVISWILGTILAGPLSRFLSNAVGAGFLKSTLSYQFSLEGVLFWLGLVVLISGVASFLPAWRASRLSIREVLSYE